MGGVGGEDTNGKKRQKGFIAGPDAFGCRGYRGSEVIGVVGRGECDYDNWGWDDAYDAEDFE